MRLLSVMMAFCLVASAKEHYAKVEPYEILNVSSNVSAEVVYVDRASEGKVLGKKPYIVMDDKLDRTELESVEGKIEALQNTLEHNRAMEKNHARIIEMKQTGYDRIKDLKIKSAVEKEREYYDLLNSQNSLLQIQKEIESLRIQLSDLRLRRSQLQKSIADKHIAAPGYVLYSLAVKPASFVNPGNPLAQIADVRKGKLTLYLNAAEAQEARTKSIYLDGRKTSYTIDRMWKIADSSRLSSYRADIYVEAPTRFSQLVKVEFK